jgi:hypothetical protein
MGWKDEFIELLFTECDTDKAYKLFGEKAPKTIFRYRGGYEYDLMALENNQLWVSNMNELNDVFEGRIEIVYPQMNLNFDFLSTFMKDESDRLISEVKSKYYVACFSESPYRQDMWGNYANSSKGFCIEYYTDDFEVPVFPVIYKKGQKFYIDVSKDTEMYKILITKNDDWSHENEWRIAIEFNEQPVKGKLIEQPTPKAIYMGININQTVREGLQEYCDLMFVELYQMEMDVGNGSLIASRVNL